jgi:hypothetical protein
MFTLLKQINSAQAVTTADFQFKIIPKTFLMDKKVTFKGFPCHSQNKYRNEIEFRQIYESREFF